jgi:TP901 family phage tail tape measure protein
MADVQSNINVNINTSGALASLKQLQRQISAFHTQMSKSGTAANAVAGNQAQNLMNSINATGQFQASMRNVSTSTEQFTNALEKNKLTSREYFRYTGAATKTFGRLFASEFQTINKVARERVKDIQTQYIKMGRGANGALQAIAVRPLALDMKNLGTQTAIAAQKQQVLNQLLTQGSTKLLNFGKNTQWAGRQLMVGFTIPLIYLGTAAAKTFMKLEEQAIRFKRVYGELFTTAEETNRMVKEIQLLASEYTKYGVAVEDTMKMAADAAAMGKMGADLTAQVAQATRLAILGGVEQEDALKTTISVTNAFGVSTEDLAKKIDFLNAVENQTVVSIEDLTIAIPKAGPVVKQLGGDVEDLAFFLTAMKEGGINASEGANALKSGLASLINPSEKASKMLQGLGVNINGIVESNAGDVKSTVVEFAQALETLDPLNRARAIEQLFGKFQFSRLSTLFQNVTAQGTQASRVLTLASATTEELAILSERELSKIEDTTTYKFKKTMEDLKVALAPVGEQFLKALTPIVEFVSKILDKFNGLGEGSKKFITILTVALGAVGPIALMSFGLLANGVANIIKLFATMRSGFQRAGSSTQILGQQTNYLTQEQLEASAVAASLDQVHQRLRQTFTSEAAAVNALAIAYQRAISSQAGFIGPIRSPSGKIQGIKRYNLGTTKVPGVGNTDTVPALLTAGEAVIPASAAQDPDNIENIEDMINNKKTKPNKIADTNKTHIGGKSTPKPISEVIANNPYMSQDQKLKLISMEQLFKSQGLPATTTTKHGLVFNFSGPMNTAMTSLTGGVDRADFIAEWEKRGSDKWKASNIDPVQAKNLDKAFLKLLRESKSPVVNDSLIDKLYREKIPTLVPANDPGYLQSKKLYATDYRFNMGKGLGNTVEASIKILENAKAKGFILDYKLDERINSKGKRVTRSASVTLPAGKYNGVSVPAGTVVGMNRMGTGTTPNISQKPQKPKTAAEKTKKKNPIPIPTQITSYKQQLSVGKGFSNVDSKHLSGIHVRQDGKKVYVKPMVDLKSAIAEQRATEIARKVHGLDSPVQKLKLIVDPNTGKTLYALESAFNSKFDPSKMSKTFTKEQYFRQLVAANLRGDKDLKKGNLGGNTMADPGAAGVFDRASGKRDFANVASMIAMGKTNLSGVKGNSAGGSPFWFGNATADIAKNMTATEYDRAMKDEIKRVLPNLEKTVADFKLVQPNPNDNSLQAQRIRGEIKAYDDMVKRLKDGLNVDYKKLHALHTSIAIKPDEVIQDDKTEKTKKPKSKLLPPGVKSSQGSKDTRMTSIPKKGTSVRNVRGPKGTTIPGAANAPMVSGGSNGVFGTAAEVIKGAKSAIKSAGKVGQTIGTTLSQSAAASSRTALYGTGPVDANAKSVRRQIEKRQRAEARTQAKAQASRTSLYGTGSVDANAKSMRRNAQAEMKRSNIAAKVAYQQKIISERAAANAKATTRSKNITEKVRGYAAKREQAKQNKIAGGGRPGMGMSGGIMAASALTMAGSMAPGKLGEISQKLMMPLMGLAMIMPMLNNKFAALGVGVGLVVAAYAYQRMAFDKAQDAALELTEAMGAGADAMKNLSTFAGKVSAGEIMDKKRKDSFAPFQIQTGKSTFGQSFIAGEQGKEMTKNIGSTVKNSGMAAAKDQVVNQMASAVASGALSADQARSIVANIGQELRDYSFGIEVNARLIELLGPNGENLAKDPLEVRVKLLQDTRERMNISNDAAKRAGGVTGGDVAKIGGFTAAGAGIGAIGGLIAGGLIGSLAGPAGTAVGAAIGLKVGAVIGTVVGATAGNLFGRKDRNRRIGETSGASVAMQKIALEQQQEMLDSLDLQYQKELEIAKAAGDTNKTKTLTLDHEKNRIKLLKENALLVGDIQKNFETSEGATRKALMTGVDKSITKKYEGTALEDVAPLAKTLIDDSGVNEEIKYTLKMQLATGEIDPMQMIEIFDTFGKDKAAIENVVSIIGQFGGAFANQTMAIVGMFEDKKQATTFIASIKTKTSKEAQKQLELFQKISQSDVVVGADVLLNYYNSNPIEAEKLQTSLNAIEKLDSSKKVEIEVAATVLGSEEMQLLKADQAYFDTLPPLQQKTYLQNLKVVMGLEGDPSLTEQYKNWVNEQGGKNQGKTFSEFVTFVTQQVTEASATDISTKEGGVTTPSEPTKIDSSPLDNLLKRLRDVRKNQIKVTEGFTASQKALNNLFGGSKTIEVFSGIENDMRKIGAGEDLIDLITGMDPKEYEKRKKSLFEFDKKGNIIKLKDNAKSIGDAIASIKLGEFVSDQERMSRQIGDQTTALTRLRVAGVEGSVALEAVADATFAAAIANKKLSDEQIKKIVKTWEKATKAKNKYAATEALIGTQKELDARVSLLTRLGNNISKLNTDQIDAILNNSALQDGLMNLGIDSEEFKTTLQKTLDSANVELKIKSMTISGMEEIFTNGMSQAMEAFSVEETRLQLKFNIDNKQLVEDITTAENEISSIEFEIDDKEAALKSIADEEEKINKKYDERIEALDEVEKANASISQQQKGQLTLADALTSGDISAAARAVQEMRAQSALGAVTKQKEAVEKSRDFELSELRSKDGKSRKQLEEEIKKLQEDIFNIEEKTLEPKRETLRLNELSLKTSIEEITVLGKTREAWEGIQNLVDLARVKSAQFVKEMKDAIDIYAKLISSYQNQVLRTDSLSTTSDQAGNSTTAIEPATADKSAADKAAADKAAADKTAEDLKRSGVFSPSALASQESGAIGAASIAAQMKAYSDARLDAAEKARVSAMQGVNASAATTPAKTSAQIIAERKAKYGYIYKGGIVPKYFAMGGFAKGTDTVPAMLTPGEFVMSKYAVDSYGVDNMKKINSGESVGGSVYNNTYTLTVNAKTGANPNEIAQAVMSTIKKVDDRRIRGVSLNGR